MSAGRAAAVSGLLSVLFLVVYGFCNWVTGLRTDVGTWYFDWERRIPFVPVMILPYMSIDAFFVAAPFLCRDRAELRTLASRITAAILGAGVCFLVVPLRFAFERPVAGGPLGAIFDAFRLLDQPFNLVPSLHITLTVILAEHYARHAPGLVRTVVWLWFSLVGASTLFTYQHHVIDVAGGLVLAALCFYAYRPEPSAAPVVANVRVGSLYALGATAAAASTWATWPWGAFLLWPTASLALVASAYLGVGPGVYRKTNGRLPLSARLVLGPCLLGQRASLLYYRRHCRPWDPVSDHLFIGRVLTSAEATAARRAGVTAVLDLTAEFSEPAPLREVTYSNIPVLDLTAPTLEQLRSAAAFIERHAAEGIVYVHCKIGYSRSAAVVGAYLMKTKTVPNAAAVEPLLRAVRPSIIVRPEASAALRAFGEAST